jgi:hypothetical protein
MKWGYQATSMWVQSSQFHGTGSKCPNHQWTTNALAIFWEFSIQTLPSSPELPRVIALGRIGQLLLQEVKLPLSIKAEWRSGRYVSLFPHLGVLAARIRTA